MIRSGEFRLVPESCTLERWKVRRVDRMPEFVPSGIANSEVASVVPRQPSAEIDDLTRFRHPTLLRVHCLLFGILCGYAAAHSRGFDGIEP